MIPIFEDPVPLTDDSGVTKKILRPGEVSSGSPPAGSTVIVHYVGTLASDGSEFDSSRSRNEPFRFKLGKGSVIKGWDIGVATMKKGELALLTCQPDYAYGKEGSGKIPPDSILNFEVELLNWIDGDDVLGDGRLFKKIVKEGKGYKSPKEGETVVLDLEVIQNNEVVIEKKEFEAALKEDDKLPNGVVQCVKKMKLGEVSLITCAKELAGSHFAVEDERITFRVKLITWTEEVEVSEGIRKLIHTPGEGYSTPGLTSLVKITYQLLPEGPHEELEFTLISGTVEYGVTEALEGMKKGEKATIIVQPSHRDASDPALGELRVHVCLNDFEKEKDSWELSREEKLSRAQELKAKAGDLFNTGKIRLAARCYEKCVSLADGGSSMDNDAQEGEMKQLKLLCTSNLSLCQLKLKLYKKAIENCTKVLEKDSNNVKALFRRAQALSELSEELEAKQDLERAKEIEPDNRAVAMELRKVLKKIKIQDEREKEIFSNLFRS